MDFTKYCHCEDCPLNGTKRILGEGELEGVVFVGIAPAKEEILVGRPFVGRSGKLLKEVASQVGYKNYYLTNTLLCELPAEISNSDASKAVRCCNDRLIEEIKAIKPKLAVALGNVPLEALTGKDYKVKSIEGRIVSGLASLVLAVVHPAAVLRGSEDFTDFVDALECGQDWLEGKYQQATMTPDSVIINEENFPELLQKVENSEVVAVDLETTGRGFYPYGKDPDQIRCIILAIDNETAYIVPQAYAKDERLIKLLNESKCIFHNGQFDCGFLWQAGYRTKIYYDTFLAHYMLDEREYSHGLKKLAHKFLGAPDWEEDIKVYLPHKKSSYDLIPDDALFKYASYDAVYTHHLYEIFSKEVNSGIYSDLIIPSSNMFVELRDRGLRIDIETLMSLDDTLEANLDAAEDELRKLATWSVNPFSPKDVAMLLYDELKLPINSHFGRSTSQKALALLAGNPVVDKILECRELGKLKSTYVSGIISFLDKNFRIHPYTKLYGTVTGRLATEDPSIMNIPRLNEIKNLYIPENGHLIMEVDQKQMELRCYSLVAKDEYLKNLLLSGRDPHALVAEEATKRCGRLIDRQTAKPAVFGKLYGRGLDSFVFGYRMIEGEARALMVTIDSLFPAIGEYHKVIKSEIHSNGYLESYFGRLRRFGLILDDNKKELYRMGANFKIQSMASDINLYTMLHMYNLRDKFGATPLFPVHDSVVFDIESPEAIPLIIKEMEDYAESLVHGEMKFKVEAKVGASWGKAEEWKEV